MHLFSWGAFSYDVHFFSAPSPTLFSILGLLLLHLQYFSYLNDIAVAHVHYGLGLDGQGASGLAVKTTSPPPSPNTVGLGVTPTPCSVRGVVSFPPGPTSPPPHPTNPISNQIL
jgi:hypothetical protein